VTGAAITDSFAANRVRTRIALSVAASAGRSRVARVHEEGSLRVRFPNPTGAALEGVIVNTAGGVAGGDRYDFDLSVGAGAAMAITTAAAEKVYRSLGPVSRLEVKLAAEAGASLAWLPQETILFDRASVERSIEVDLAEGSRAVIAESIVFGRTAMGEAVESGRIVDRWRVRFGGRLVYADTLRLEGAIARKLGLTAVARGGRAIATVLAAPGGEREVETVRSLAERFAGEVGISSWNGLCVARLCAPDSAVLRADMTMLLSALGTGVPRLWLN
jgi:urease accessory protein